MIAFAGNSLLCRQALGDGTIDAASFSTIRVIAGAIMLLILTLPQRGRRGIPKADWASAAMLFTYMAFFSFSYLSLSAGTGALILFGAVQLTMFAVSLYGGESFSKMSWIGFGFAVAGLVYLLLPGVSAPDAIGAGLMMIAGIAWGVYSLLGRSASDPLESTTSTFFYTVPMVFVLSAVF